MSSARSSLAVAGWMVSNPRGEAVVHFAATRLDAIRHAFDPRHGMPFNVHRELNNLHDRTAGWCAIECRGWRVAPLRARPVR